LPSSNQDAGSKAVSSFMQTREDIYMSNFAYLGRKTGLNHFQILKLPYSTYLMYLKHHSILDLQETEEGRKYLAKIGRLSNKEIDLTGLRRLTGYKTQEKVGE
jgi:hypothetical protein